MSGEISVELVNAVGEEDFTLASALLADTELFDVRAILERMHSRPGR